MVTIKDIAKRAGVAQGTVSNVLNGKGNVRSEKSRRVLEAAHELGYIPNERAAPVSYTHLDVYKRQGLSLYKLFCLLHE